MAEKAGLILADTKYEFGFDENGVLTLGDEIHTPDSSRYWMADSYDERVKAGEAPITLDKDQVRRWVVARCDPYKDDIPEIPDDLRVATAEVYIDVYEKITGEKFNFPDNDSDPEKSVLQTLENIVDKKAA